MTPELITLLSTILVALTGLIGTIITTRSSSKDIQHELDKQNAVQNTKLEELTSEVRLLREQNKEFATTIPVLVQRVTALEKETFKNK